MSPLQRAHLAEVGQANTHLFSRPAAADGNEKARLLSPAHAAAAAGTAPPSSSAAAAAAGSAAGSRRGSDDASGAPPGPAKSPGGSENGGRYVSYLDQIKIYGYLIVVWFFLAFSPYR